MEEIASVFSVVALLEKDANTELTVCLRFDTECTDQNH